MMNHAVKNQIEKELNSHQLKIANANSDYQKLYETLEKRLCGSLVQGFNVAFSQNFSATETNEDDNIGLHKMSTIFEWDFAKIIEQNKISSILLDDIAQLLNISDKEKERKTAIEKGLTFLKQATLSQEFYAEAKRFFEKALEQEDIDYYVLYNLGLIHLFSDCHFDPEIAQTLFSKSAKYATVGSSFSKPRYGERSSLFNSMVNPLTIAGQALLYAARASYSLDKIDEAFDTINEAILIDPDNSDFLFDKCIYLLERNKLELCITILRKILERDYLLVLKLLKNKKMVENDAIREMLYGLVNDRCDEVKNEYLRCTNSIANESVYAATLNQISDLIENDNYLSVSMALDILFPHQKEPLLTQIESECSIFEWVDEELAFYRANYPKVQTLQAKVSHILDEFTSRRLEKIESLKAESDAKFAINYTIPYGDLSFFDYSNITLTLKEHIQFDLSCVPLLHKKNQLFNEQFKLSLKKIPKGSFFSTKFSNQLELENEKKINQQQLKDLTYQIDNWLAKLSLNSTQDF